MRRRRPIRLLIAAVGVLSLPVLARDVPDFHIRAQTRSLGRIQLPGRAGVPGQVASRDERTGTPTFLWADPWRTSPAVSSTLASRAPVDAVARAHLGDYAAHFGLDASALQALEVRQVHDTGNGAIIVRLAPRVGTLEVYGESVAVVMDRYRQPIAISGSLHPSRPGEADALLAGFRLKPEQVVTAAYRDLIGVDGFSLRANGQFKGDYQYFELASSGAPERLVTPARAKPLAFRNGKTLVPAYYVELDTQDAAGQFHGYAYVVSAKNGQLLVRTSLINSAAFTYRVYADNSGQFRPWDGPFGNGLSPSPSGVVGGTPVPPTVGSSLVTLDHGPIGTGDPWLPASATVTTGNNVDAYTDTIGPDGFTAVNPDGGVPDLRADLTGPATFDRTFDFTHQPDATLDQAKAAVTQVFFTNNWLHDWYYDVGFDEASGNAQADNLGRGDPDRAGDVLHAETHDFSGVNNANMFTPADGASPRQQMYLWTGPQLNKLTVNAPAAIAGDYSVGVNSSFGPQGYSITGDVVLVNDGSASPTQGCNAITNNVTGKIALIDRGTCAFVVKVKNAQNAGAIAVIIANNAAGTIPMGGTDATITIGALMVSLADGTTLKTALASNTVNATLFRQDPTSIVEIDGSFDNAVIAHEWGHYIAHRLVGGGDGFAAQVTNGMGEGWSDFHGLLLIVRPEDAAFASNANWAGTYAVGVFDTTGGASIDPVYFAIRRYPYSTDMTKDPLTFKHITTGVVLPAGVPAGFTAADNAEVHATGEIWATMLWECYAALLNAHPFQTAQDRMRGYIVAGYKATPPNATFVEARDALLAVVGAADGADYQLFGQAFAKRGLGTGAIAPDRFDTTNGQAPHPPLVESFFWGPDIHALGLTFADSVVSCDQDGVLDRGETGFLSVTLQNAGKNDLSQGVITVTSTTPGIAIADGGVFGVGTLTAGKSRTVRMPISLALTADAGPTIVDLDIGLVDPEIDAGVFATRMLSGTVSFRADTDDLAGALATDDVEGTTTAWTVQSAHGSDNPWVRLELTSPVDHAWFAEDPDRASDESLITPPLQVGTAPLVLTFQGSWFEEFDSGGSYDGVVVEISADNGATWNDVKSVGGTLNPDYNVTLFDAGTAAPGAFNPLQGRPAWGQENPAAVTAGTFPTYQTVTVNLGTGFANKTVLVRFRSGSDVGGAAVGFLIDNLTVAGITNTPFVKLVPDALKCRPVADAGVAITVNERAMGVLPGSYVQTPGTTPPSMLWTQTSGPSISLNPGPTVAQPSFVAPEVSSDSTATFTLTANGIQGSSSSNLTVTIKNVNRPPIAHITGPTEAKAKDTVSLSGSTSTDPDNDTLTYAWSQTGGPAVTLDGANTANVTFTAPDASGSIGIQLTVTDPSGASSSATTSINLLKSSGCSSSGGSPLPLLALLALGLLLRARRRSA